MRAITDVAEDRRAKMLSQFFLQEMMRRDADALRFILKHKEGRWFLQRLLEQTMVTGEVFTGNSTTFYNEGKRHMGITLLENIRSLGKEAILLRQKGELEYEEAKLKANELALELMDKEDQPMDENAQQAADVQTNTEPAPQQEQAQDIIQQAQAESPAPEADAPKPTEAGENVAEPTVYDFKPSTEGYSHVEFNEENTAKFTEVIKDMGLSNEQANSIVKFGMDWMESAMQQMADAQAKQNEEWKQTSLKELGSSWKDGMEANVARARDTIEREIPGFTQMLAESGLGNRIEMIKMLNLFSTKISEDPGMASGTTSNRAGAPSTSRYPNTDFNKYL